MQILETRPNGTPREVKLDNFERAASDRFERLLDDGHDIPTAVSLVRDRSPFLSDEFYAWLGN